MSAKQTSGAATRTDTPDGVKFTEGERAIIWKRGKVDGRATGRTARHATGRTGRRT